LEPQRAREPDDGGKYKKGGEMIVTQPKPLQEAQWQANPRTLGKERNSCIKGSDGAAGGT